MAFEFALPDTSTRRRLAAAAEGFAPSDADILRYLALLRSEGRRGLQESFGAAAQNIGAQFTPQFRMAQARLGGAPLLADSGYANRLNRQLQQAAFGQLSNAFSTAAAEQAGREFGSLSDLINQRLAARQAALQALLGSAQKKRGWFGQFAGQALGTALGVGLKAAV